MMRKTMMIKLAGFLAVLALLFGSFPGSSPVALAEEAAVEEAVTGIAEEENDDADAGTADAEPAPEPVEEAPEGIEGAQETSGEETAGVTDGQETAMEESADAGTEQDDAGEAAETVEEETADTETVPDDAGEAAETVEEETADAGTEQDTTADAPEAAEENQEAPEEEPEDSSEPDLPEEDCSDDSEDPEDPDGKEDLVVLDDNDAGSVEGDLLEQFNNPETYEPAQLIGTAEIVLVNQGMLNYGDEIVLMAMVRNMNLNYRLVWEANDGDGRGWFAVGSGDEYRFSLDEVSAEREYRVVVIAVG